MIKLRLSLEYRCYPLWIYGENDEFIDNNFPDELDSYIEIDTLLDEIQSDFDGLFIDNEKVFDYVGFSDNDSREMFSNKINRVEKMIRKAIGAHCILENKVDVTKL